MRSVAGGSKLPLVIGSDSISSRAWCSAGNFVCIHFFARVEPGFPLLPIGFLTEDRAGRYGRFSGQPTHDLLASYAVQPPEKQKMECQMMYAGTRHIPPKGGDTPALISPA
jgi:hypothetical protein